MKSGNELPLGVFAVTAEFVVADSDFSVVSEHDSAKSASVGLAVFLRASEDGDAAIYHRTRNNWEVF